MKSNVKSVLCNDELEIMLNIFVHDAYIYIYIYIYIYRCVLSAYARQI